MYLYRLDIDEYEYCGWKDVQILTSKKKYKKEELEEIIDNEKRKAETLEELYGILHDKFGFHVAKIQFEVTLYTSELGKEYYENVQIKKDSQEAEDYAAHAASLQRMEMSLRILEKYSRKPPENE